MYIIHSHISELTRDCHAKPGLDGVAGEELVWPLERISILVPKL